MPSKGLLANFGFGDFGKQGGQDQGVEVRELSGGPCIGLHRLFELH